MKKEETNDIVQYFLPKLAEVEIKRENCKIDVTTERSGNKRGDVWISQTTHNSKDFEKKIVALVEAKHKKATIGDIDWRDAMAQGKEKSAKQGLNYYGVTNCTDNVRFYNSFNDEEIVLDGIVLTKFVGLDILLKMRTQVAPGNSYVIHKANRAILPLSESKFRDTLARLADTYRSAGLKKGDERIDPTVSFVVLKYISEKEKEERTLDPVIRLWGDFRGIADDRVVGDLKVEFETTIELIWGSKSAYANNVYRDFKDLVVFPSKLQNNHFKKIFKALDEYHFHGANFDLYGAIYEEFASQMKKREFGEFYTRRHITGVVSRLLLRNEKGPRSLKVCDPACGTGGFLTEGYKTLIANYSTRGKLDAKALKGLKEETFWGFDNDDKSVARTKLNMFLVGDGHMHIYETQDSLIDWMDGAGWRKNEFDYLITNPPMGQYEGSARIEDFKFTNERRFELMFMERVIDATKPGGEIAIVLNDGALEAPTRENFRKKVLDNCDINAIVSLTKFAFAPYTKEKTYVLFLQKKQPDKVGQIQSFPIWSFILDYDGYANSDKRYRTKYHDDIPELEEKFGMAVELARIHLTDKARFAGERHLYERNVNDQELREGLSGFKYRFVQMDEVGQGNFYNLLSEFHLRPLMAKKMNESEFNAEFARAFRQFKKLSKDSETIVKDVRGGSSGFAF